MKVLIDGDACPVISLAELIAEIYDVPVTILSDPNHRIVSDYSTVKVIGQGPEAVDIALMNICEFGDIVITQDYGLATMALGRGARVIHQNGWWYAHSGKDLYMKKLHLKKVYHPRGKHKRRRMKGDDRNFALSFERLLRETIQDMKYYPYESVAA